MAEHGESKTSTADIFDGRFGEQFDDEIRVRPVFWISVTLAAVCALAFLVTWFVWKGIDHRIDAAEPGLSPLIDSQARRLPPLPRLQAKPEEELLEMRREIAAQLNGYGWVDEATGKVYVPVDTAIDLLVERGLPAAAEPAAADTTSLEPAAADSAEENSAQEESAQEAVQP